MKNIILFISLSILFFSCNKQSDKNYINSNKLIEGNQTEEHPGKQLMDNYCSVCHNNASSHEDRVAPPMIAVKKHYINENITKEEFISSLRDWVNKPTEENSKMSGAIRKFGIMPYAPYPDDAITKIAEYIYDYEIEQPEWFDSHFKKGHGKGKGKNKSKMGKEASNQEFFDTTDKSFAEIGKYYALQTKKELGKNLMRTIQRKGTIEALSYCNERAYTITDSMSNIFNATIKRVSDKPRNSNNTANKIELDYIQRYKKDLKDKKELKPVIVENNDVVNFYYPITTNSMCLQCHGKLNVDVKINTFQKIKTLYPKDKAMNYQVNNVRGIWSIEFKKD
jgi:cytochrome c553